MTNKAFNTERKFGVEIEFFFFDVNGRGGLSVSTRIRNIIAELAEKGIELVQEGYNHHTRSHWKLVTDSSVSYEGLEIVSPPLKGREGLKQLEAVLEALNKYNAKVDKTCGVHVHHDINDYDLKSFKNLYATYIKFEKVFDSFVPKSRRGDRNSYCRSVAQQEGDTQLTLQAVKRVNTVEGLQNLFHNRYKKLNIKSYVKYGTIEFRQHAGSTDYIKIMNWIILTQQLVDNAKVRKVDFNYNERWDTITYFSDVMNMTKGKGADEYLVNALNYFKKRAKELASA